MKKIPFSTIDLEEMKPTDITQYDHIYILFSKFISQLKLNFHPDTYFIDYIDRSTGKIAPSFSKSDAKQYQALLDRSFRLCNTYKWDIYEIAINATTLINL